jgi:NTE family protein
MTLIGVPAAKSTAVLRPEGCECRRGLPDVPGPASILRRCLCVHQNPDLLPTEPFDLVLAPPPFPGSSFLDFDRHSEVFAASYKWCCTEVDKLVAEHNPALEPILATRN